MDLSDSVQFDIFDVYRRYCDIKSGSSYFCKDGIMVDDESQSIKLSRDTTSQLLEMVETNMNTRGSIMDDLRKLMSCLNVMGDFSEFSQFYDFVFFLCRENGQKNITISRAIAAWKLVLTGRFRLLNQWCDFVEKNQRYNISEDTWRQVLAFSRCVHEDLEGYDPEGAWPTLIDDFVEHMYRVTGSNNCSSHSLTCNCGDPESESLASEDPLPGLRSLPGLKRKFLDDCRKSGLEQSSLPPDVINSIISFKRRKQQPFKVSSLLNTLKSPCAVEGCLTKGFAGLFSSAPSLQNQERGVSCTERI